MSYNGNIEIIAGIKQKNNQNFFLINAANVYVDEEIRFNTETTLDALIRNIITKLEELEAEPSTAVFGTAKFGSAVFG